MPKVDETLERLETSNADLFAPPSVPAVAANVTLKLPVFWPEAAEVWFAQADAQFAIRSITVSKTKFYHAVASLPQDVAAQILDLIRAPPARDPYGVLSRVAEPEAEPPEPDNFAGAGAAGTILPEPEPEP